MRLSANVLDTALSKNLPLGWANRNLIVKLRTNFYYHTRDWCNVYKELDGAEWYSKVDLEEDPVLIDASDKYLEVIYDTLPEYTTPGLVAVDVLTYATLGLLAFPNAAASLFNMPINQVKTLALLGNQSAILLYPALLALDDFENFRK